MDRLVAETEVEKQEEILTKVETSEKLPVIEKSESSYQTEYLSSLDNVTIGQFKEKQEQEKEIEFEKEKKVLIQEQFEKEVQKQESQNIIEKPNYDLIEENKKVIKLRKTFKSQPKEKKKNTRTVILAVGLAICSVLCVTNITLLDNYSSNLANLEQEFYEVNLPKYLKNISNLDSTKKSMEFLETYPEEELDAGDLGEKTNWYDKFCNFISGIFGG